MTVAGHSYHRLIIEVRYEQAPHQLLEFFLVHTPVSSLAIHAPGIHPHVCDFGFLVITQHSPSVRTMLGTSVLTGSVQVSTRRCLHFCFHGQLDSCATSRCKSRPTPHY